MSDTAAFVERHQASATEGLVGQKTAASAAGLDCVAGAAQWRAGPYGY